MIHWERMAETGSTPGVSAVAAGALSGKMIGWFVSGVTALTISSSGSGMIKTRWIPGIGTMTTGTLPTKVVRRFVIGMAALTIGRTSC